MIRYITVLMFALVVLLLVFTLQQEQQQQVKAEVSTHEKFLQCVKKWDNDVYPFLSNKAKTLLENKTISGQNITNPPGTSEINMRNCLHGLPPIPQISLRTGEMIR
jgi:hypothetical protein